MKASRAGLEKKEIEKKEKKTIVEIHGITDSTKMYFGYITVIKNGTEIIKSKRAVFIDGNDLIRQIEMRHKIHPDKIIAYVKQEWDTTANCKHT